MRVCFHRSKRMSVVEDIAMLMIAQPTARCTLFHDTPNVRVYSFMYPYAYADRQTHREYGVRAVLISRSMLSAQDGAFDLGY